MLNPTFCISLTSTREPGRPRSGTNTSWSWFDSAPSIQHNANCKVIHKLAQKTEGERGKTLQQVQGCRWGPGPAARHHDLHPQEVGWHEETWYFIQPRRSKQNHSQTIVNNSKNAHIYILDCVERTQVI